MSKKELERRQRKEQEATALAFQEFIKTFQDTSGPPNKLFVRAGILNTKTGREEEAASGQIYNPSVLIKPSSSTLKNAIECARLLKENKLEKSRGVEKPKSNLELLKEELRQRHLERDARNKLSKEFENAASITNFGESFDTQNTTNLFLANLNPKLTENDLMQIFGAYGPLASVKIMWPRSDEKNRNIITNCGFVAYMSRKDGERALNALKSRDDMRIGWGKPVELPTHPVYIPPDLLKLVLPPPPPFTGLPFNAQPMKSSKNSSNLEDLLYNSLVKVTIPSDKKILMLIHHTVEFVVNEGPMFEAMLMNNEINNPQYQFLFDNKSANHIYYRWKMYSILQGDSPSQWSTKSFRMFDGGSIWVPPVIPNYSEGMPETLISKPVVNKQLLSDAQKTRLVENIQQLQAKRSKIGEAMIFCLNHGDACKDVVDIITSSFDNETTKASKKITRLYLVSDILYNTGFKKLSNYGFREDFKTQLPNIFEKLYQTFINLKTTMDKDAYKMRVFNVLRAWDLWKIYDSEFLDKLEQSFTKQDPESHEYDSAGDEPLDGNSLIKRSLQNYDAGHTDNCIIINKKSLSAAVEKKQSPKKEKADDDDFIMQGFIPSKWESIDPEVVEAQAMSTQKFIDLEYEIQAIKSREKMELEMDEEREKLRKIELMAMRYQDDIESGKVRLKKGESVQSQVDAYRLHLLKKRRQDKDEYSSPSDSESSTERRSKKHSRKSKSSDKKKYKDKDSKYRRHR